MWLLWVWTYVSYVCRCRYCWWLVCFLTLITKGVAKVLFGGGNVPTLPLGVVGNLKKKKEKKKGGGMRKEKKKKNQKNTKTKTKTKKNKKITIKKKNNNNNKKNYLIIINLPKRKILTLSIRHIQTTHTSSRIHSQRLSQLTPNFFFHFHQPPHFILFSVVGLRGVTRGWANALFLGKGGGGG